MTAIQELSLFEAWGISGGLETAILFYGLGFVWGRFGKASK
jgi:hypothetical protein